ncbi:MAG: PASTA domain-containing protein [Rubrobacter sp.]|nr:PASTA domain-containing protein [Rubrobacter sp.]
MSRHRELAAALRTFLARVTALGQVAEAMLLAHRYHVTNRETLSGWLVRLAAESEQNRFELQKIAAESEQRFEAEWGLQGRKCLELREKLRQTIAVGKQSFSNTLQMGGDIELSQKAKINAVRSLISANQVAKKMPGEVVTATIISWVGVCKEVQHRCTELLRPFVGVSDELDLPLNLNIAGLTVLNSSFDIKFKADYFMMLRGAASGSILLGAASAALAATGVSLPPLGLIAVPVVLVLVGSGIRNVRESQLKSARQELRAHLMEVLQKVRRHFFDVDLTSARFSRVDEYFRALEHAVNEQVRKIAENKSKHVYARTARLTEAMKLDNHECNVRAKRIHEQLGTWDDIGKATKDVIECIKELDAAISISSSSGVLPVLRRPDKTLPLDLSRFDEKDMVAAVGATHTPNIRWPMNSGLVAPSSPPPQPDPAPLDRYRKVAEATSTKGKPDKAKADWSNCTGQLGPNREQAAYVEPSVLKHETDLEADHSCTNLKEQHDSGATVKEEFEAQQQQPRVLDDVQRWWDKCRETHEWHNSSATHPNEEKQRRGVLRWIMVVIILGTLPLVGGVSLYLWSTSPVPDLRGKTISEAVQIAGTDKIDLLYVQASEQPQGTILHQSPGSSERSGQGSTIRVVLSGGQKREVEVPDVSGLDSVQAASALIDEGLNPEGISARNFDQSSKPQATSPTIEKITTTDPSAGSVVETGDHVNVR